MTLDMVKYSLTVQNYFPLVGIQGAQGSQYKFGAPCYLRNYKR